MSAPQIRNATLREIQFEHISLQDLLFLVRYFDVLLLIFAELPLKESPSYTQQYNQATQVINWPQIGHPEQVVPYAYQNDVENRNIACQSIENWFALQVGLRLSQSRPFEEYQKFFILSSSLYGIDPLPFRLPANLRVSRPLRELQAKLSVIMSHSYRWKDAICTPFSMTTNPLHGDPNIFSILSDVEQILQSAIEFQGLSDS